MCAQKLLVSDLFDAHQDLPTFLDRSPSALAAYTLVISVDAPPAQTQALAERCWTEGVPLLVARTSGFIVSFSVQVAEVCHVETHPANTIDLRAKEPFPALLDYVNALDFDVADSLEHGHLPAIAILVRALEDWKASVRIRGGARSSSATNRCTARRRASEELRRAQAALGEHHRPEAQRRRGKL